MVPTDKGTREALKGVPPQCTQCPPLGTLLEYLPWGTLLEETFPR